MATEDFLLTMQCLLVLGTGATYLYGMEMTSEKALSLSWFAVCPVAVVYGDMLLKFLRYENNRQGEPPASKLSCLAALLCALLTQFVAIAHARQALEWVFKYSHNRKMAMNVDIYLVGKFFAASVAWMCYLATVCFLELESFNMFLQGRKEEEAAKYL